MTVETQLRVARPHSSRVLPSQRVPRLAPPVGSALPLGRSRPVLLACLATLAVHLMFLTRALGSDEGGYSVVARFWQQPGAFLYGPQWVDRPPGLIAVFWVADQLGPFGARIVAALVATALVAAIAWAASVAGGPRAAGWAAWTGFALGSSVLLQTQQLNGELIAATLVALSVAAGLRAMQPGASRRSGIGFGTLAGAAALGAVLVKQSFVDGFVFLVVLVAMSLLVPGNRQRTSVRRLLPLGVGVTLGAGLGAALTVLWAHAHGGLDALLYAMYGFRGAAATVIAHWSWHAPMHRLHLLLLVAVLSGVVYLAVAAALAHGRGFRRLEPLPWAITATVLVEVLGIAAGENFWRHYLIALVPMVSLAVGLASRRAHHLWRPTRLLTVFAVVTTAVLSPLAAVVLHESPNSAYTIGRWLAASAHSHDTVVVPFTHPTVIDTAGLTPDYPYSWSLPVRTLDPDLTRLTATLDGSAAPTWVVRWDAAHTWGLDPHSRVHAALETHYRRVTDICGHPVWLHRGVVRNLAATPGPDHCGGRHS